MKEIIWSYSRTKAKNAQHVQFVTDVLKVVTEEVATAQGFAEQRAAFASAATDEQARFQPYKSFMDTPEVTNADALRDDTYSFYRFVTKAYADYCPDPDGKSAGQTVWYLFHEAGEATRQDYASETAILTDLVGKMREEPFTAALQTMGMGEAPDKIEAANDAFNEIYAKRAAEDRQRVFSVGMKELRGRADDAFDALAKAINALYLVNEMTTKDEGKSTALAALIDDVNTYVVRLRKTMGGTASSSGTEGEEGSSTPTDPTNPDPSEPGGEEPGGEETDSPSGI